MMKKSFFIAILLLLPFFVLASSHSDDGFITEDTSIVDINLRSIVPIIIGNIPATHKIKHSDLLLSWTRENVPLSNNSLKVIFSRLSKEYLDASEIVLSKPTAGKYLPDSLTLLELLEEKAILFDLEKGAELHLHPWELKIEFLGLALYYALQAKESLPKNLIVLRRHAEVHRSNVLKQCGDPFEIAAFDIGCEVWKYAEMLKKELAIYAAFEVGIYQRLLEKKELYGVFLKDLAYHMANGIVLRGASTHPIDGLISEYSGLSEVWKRRYEAFSAEKRYPLPESLSKKSKSTEKVDFEFEIHQEIERLTQQVLTLQTISAELGECRDIFSAKLGKITGDNIALKASGTADVIEGVMLFTNTHQNLLYEIYFERFWRLLSLVGTLVHVKSTILLPDALDGVLMNARHFSLATFNRIIMDLALVKGMAQEIELRAIKKEPSSTPRIEPKSRSFLNGILNRS